MVRPPDPHTAASGLPSVVLDTPYPKEPIPDLVNQILGAGDWLNVSHWLAEGMDLVFGFNPGKAAAEFVVGDWEKVSTASSALSQLAEYAVRLAGLVDDGATAMFAHWDGNAATSADVWFDRFAVAVDGLAQPLQSLAGQYQAAAAGIVQMTAAVTSLLESLGDRLIGIAMRTATAAAVARVNPTAAGLLHSWIMYDTYKSVALWTSIIEKHGEALMVMQSITGRCAGYLSTLGGFEGPRLPGSYNHPHVDR